MQLFRDTHIEFLKYRRFFVVVSAVLIGAGIFSVFVHGKLNLGVDFAGGTQVTLKFRERPEIDELRRLLAEGGVPDAQLQRFGQPEDNEVLIKTPTVEGSEEGSLEPVLAALDGRYNPGAGSRVDLNRAGTEAISALLARLGRDRERAGAEAAGTEESEAQAAPEEGDAAAAADAAGGEGPVMEASTTGIAEALVALRREDGLIAGWDRVAALPEVGPEVLARLQEEAGLGDFAVLGVENVGPQIGRELRRKGQLAVVLSLLGMMAYIWARFELRFGIGAVVAGLHDILITLGFFAVAGYEFNLTTIAAFLTLVGYSVNDTVVIFDRVRENLRRTRRLPTEEVMNQSLNQTLSRTVLTSGTTLVAVTSLWLLGGDVIRGFAFVMVVGVVVGTYSSVFVACPFALLWEQVFSRQARGKRVARKSATSEPARNLSKKAS